MKNILYINYKEKVLETSLPAIDNREFSININDISEKCSILMEVFDGKWVVKESENMELFVKRERVKSCQLESGMIINFRYNRSLDIVVIVKELTESVRTFRKYDISNVQKFRVGQSKECEISIEDSFISNCHAVIVRKNEDFYITDQSTNGTYINGVRITENVKLNVFDEIYTVGFKMVFLGNIIAINRADEITSRLQPIEYSEHVMDEKKEDGGIIVFSTAPREIEQLDKDNVSISAPPSKAKHQEQPLLFVLGPSLTMPLPMMANLMLTMGMGGGFSLVKLITSLSSILLSSGIGVCWNIARRKYAKKTSEEQEKIRVDAYRKYLSKTARFLTDKHITNRNTLNFMYPSAENLIGRISENSSILWNHSPRQDDFLTFRLGKGSVDFPGDIKIPPERFSIQDDELEEKPWELYENFKYIKDAVSLLELRKHNIIGVVGERSNVNNVAINILVQLASEYSYIDVKTAIFYDSADEDAFKWTKWLPHTFTSDKKMRMIADNKTSAQNILFHLAGEMRKRREDKNDAVSGMLPYYIVFCTSPSFFEDDIIEKYMISEESLGVCFVLLYKESVLLPNACKYIIHSDKEYNGRYALDEKKSITNETEFDIMDVNKAEKFARRISGMYIKELSTGEIPNSVDYLDMLGIGRLEQWDLMRHYKENRVYEHIRSFVGITTGNKPMFLDIHEKKYGPHGLVAGTTGSGKSETIQTFIISLALNYHPNEISFILIDYKGGGMANAFLGMPHLAGTITNLSDGSDGEMESIDGSQTRRALISIKSEIKRRQSIFNQYKVNHIDTYIRMFREGKVSEPLPHLVIISDEFAELKKEQPEFIKELVSTARVGRSLGIHLILATQKPAGVVDEEIWSNSRFKVCLRVQDRQDSNGMLKRPDAAYITQTGRAYLQIGNDEIFEMFQSGYSGAEYNPKDEVSKAGETVMIEIDGSRSVCEAVRKKRTDSITQLEACVQYITRICKENDINWVRPLWLPQLSSRIFYKDIISDYKYSDDKITAVFGMIDNPEKQDQYPAVINLTECGNLLISGNSGSGKSVLIQTMLYSITRQYTSEQVNYYIMDFSGHILNVFAKAPHCGGVVSSDDEEAVKHTITLISNMISARKKLFNRAGVSGYTEYCNIEKLPLTILVIDNYFVFNELFENLTDMLSKVLREGPACGIQTIISISHQNDIKYRQRQNILNSIALKLSDRTEYYDVLGSKPDFTPMNCKGRGLMHSDGMLLEYQTALAVDAESEFERSKLISAEMERLAADNRHTAAKKIPVIPKSESYSEFLNANFKKGNIPLGYDLNDISIVNFNMADSYCMSMYSHNGANISLLIDSIFETGRKIDAEMFYCCYRGNEIKCDSDGAVRCRDYKSLFDMLVELKGIFKERSGERTKMLNENPDADTVSYFIEATKPVFVVIDNMCDFLEVIYDSSNAENMYSITETFFKQGAGLNVYFFAGFEGSSFIGNYYKQACKIFTSYKCGVLLGGRLDGQNLFDFQMNMSEKMKTTNPNVGYFVGKNTLRRIHLPTIETYEEE